MAALVLYASLYPFDGWRWPPGGSLAEMLALPWPRWRLPFDLWANFAGYLPLGALVALSLPRRHPGWALLAGAAGPALLSYLTEVAQHLLPGRHPSALDLALNSAGAAAGSLIGLGLRALGWVDRWRAWLARWFERKSVTALALLALWPVALLAPSPVAFGLGQIGPRLKPWLIELLTGVPWAEPLRAALAAPAVALAPANAAIEGSVSMLGLLAPCLVAFAVVDPGWRRIVLGAGAGALAVGVVTMSTALNYGPQHALSWWTPLTTPAMVAAAVLALAMTAVPRRLLPGLGLIGLTALVALVAQAPADPYHAHNLSAWEQGRFIHLHGLTRWVAWLWPYAAMAWLLVRLTAGQDAHGARGS